VIGACGFGDFSKEARKIRVRLDAIGAGRCDQRVQASARGRTGGGLPEQPIPPSDHHHAVILPISGEKSKFTIAGIHFTGDAHMPTTASSAPPAASFMLRSSRVL
jgi:hypothetical protein